MQQRPIKLIITCLLIIFLMVLVHVTVMSTVDSWEHGSGLRVDSAEDAIDAALLQCYALEGAYPSSLWYLSEHYGIIIDERVYLYHYDYVGSNIRPAVRVVRR